MPGLDPSGRRRRRRRKSVDEDTAAASAPAVADEAPAAEESREAGGSSDTEDGWGRRARECPVPKPGGLIGQVFGFKKDERERPVVRIETAGSRKPEGSE